MNIFGCVVIRTTEDSTSSEIPTTSTSVRISSSHVLYCAWYSVSLRNAYMSMFASRMIKTTLPSCSQAVGMLTFCNSKLSLIRSISPGSASSITSVRIRSVSAALISTLLRSSSLMRIVVLMHQYINNMAGPGFPTAQYTSQPAAAASFGTPRRRDNTHTRTSSNALQNVSLTPERRSPILIY